MAEWIESWDLEAMTSNNREIGVRGVFSPGVHTHGFSPLAESVLADLSINSSKF